MYAALLGYVGKYGVLCCRVGGSLDGSCRDPAIMAYLVPNRGSLEGGSAADCRDAFRRARGSC
jgi:hypothetical protein